MPRIICRSPASGKEITPFLLNVGSGWATLLDAPDFSVPDPSLRYSVRDPADTVNRAIRPGCITVLTPIMIRNRGLIDGWIESRIVFEDGTLLLGPRYTVPVNDTVMMPYQGRTLTKRQQATANGDRLQFISSFSVGLGVNNPNFDVQCSVEERLSSEHL
jgi:hypothetical protein